MRSRMPVMLLPVILLFASCDGAGDDPDSLLVSFVEGQRWSYDLTQVIRDSAGTVISAIRDSFEVRVASMRDSVLGMSGLVRLEARSILPVGISPTGPDTQRVWYRMTASKLEEVAYQNASGNFSLLKGAPARAGSLFFGFFDPTAAISRAGMDTPPLRRDEDRVVLVQPVVAGAEWVSFSVPFLQSRVVEELAEISLPFRTFFAARIRTRSDVGGDPIVFYDWVAAEGLVRRRMEMRIYFATESDPEAAFPATVVTESLMTSIAQ